MEVLRTTLLWIAAIIMAIEQRLRSAPNLRARLPRFVASENWNFAPLVLLIIIFLIWIVRSVSGPQPINQEVAALPHTYAATPASSPSLTFGWENLHETGAMEIEAIFIALPKPCIVRITIPQEHRNFRAILVRII